MTRHNAKGLLRDRRGAVAAWVALMLVMLLGVAALTIDMGFLWVLRDRLQATADAAALAGAAQLPVEVDAKSGAVNYANKNLPPGAHGKILCTAGVPLADCPDGGSDVVLGHWEGAPARTFTCHTAGRSDPTCPKPADETTNAVKVTIRKAQANGNPAQLFFARVLGIQTADVVTEAIAEWYGEDNCLQEGVIAGGVLHFGLEVTIQSGYCFYGRDFLEIGRDFYAEAGTVLGSLDENNIGHRARAPDCDRCTILGDRVSYDLQPEAANNLSAILDFLENPSVNPNGYTMPPQINNVVVVDKDDPSTWLPDTPGYSVLPSNLQDGTLYIVYGNVRIQQYHQNRDIIIAARCRPPETPGPGCGNVRWDQGGTFINSDPDCQNGGLAIGVFAETDIRFGQNATAVGVDMVAGNYVWMGHAGGSFGGTIQSAADIRIDYGANMSRTECASLLSFFGPISGYKPRLVN